MNPGDRQISKDIESILMVFGVLITVTILMAFFPKRPEFFLYRLSESFGIEERASNYRLKSEWFCIRPALERLRLDAYFPWQYVRFDVEMDNRGVWMSFVGPEPGKCAPSILVPWYTIVFIRHIMNHSYFTLLADEPVGITVRRPLGEAINRYLLWANSNL